MMCRTFAVVTAVLVARVAFSQVDLPQQQAVPQQGLNPESFYGKDSSQGVYVRDSAIALEKFAQAQRMERLHEWNKSADVYQEILEKYADRVVPSQIDRDNNIYQYTSVATAVQEKLARWPSEGLDVYRARFESVAAGLLASAGRDDLSALHKVFSLYFVTDSGRTAGLRLVDLYIESGEFPAAAWLGDRMLTWHPNLLVERPKLLYRVALAYHLAGDEAKSRERSSELKQKHADAKGTIRGQDVALADSLERELKVATPIAHNASGDSWPMFGGSPDRGRVSDAKGRPGARLYSIDLSKPNYKGRGVNPHQLQDFLQRDDADREAGSALGVMPVVDRSELYFQDGSHVYAVSLDTGLPLPGWLATYGLDRNGQYSINTVGSPRGQQLTITLTDDSVLAVMGQPNRLAITNGVINAAEHNSRLVCLDRATGKEKWVVTPAQLPDEAQALRTLDFVGSPLVVGDNVYLMGRGGKGVQFEDCHVLCFDVNTGKYRWSCYIASANTANQMWGDVGGISDNVSHIAYASGRLYALTNLGAVAAVDAYRGTIQWLNIYPRDLLNDPNNNAGMIAFRGRFNRGGDPQLIPARPWTYNPVVVQDGRVFVLPSDGKHVLIYDAGNGAEIKRIATSDVSNADTLLGVVGNRLVLAGEKQVPNDRDGPRGLIICLDWQKYDSTRTNPADDAILWQSPLLMAIRGRGFVTNDSVFVPCEDRLVRFSLSGGKMEQRYPQWNPWESGEGRGNVLVTQNHVILAGDRRVEVYTDLTMARSRLDAEVAAAGNNPDPRLKYAEIMFASGQTDVAAQKLDEAIELLGGAASMRPGASRDRTFSDALTFAQKLVKENKDGAPQDLADRFFDRAAAAASTPAQQVQYRRSRAKLEDIRLHFAAEVKLYQEILVDSSLRAVMVADDENSGSTTAGAIAEQSIEAVIRKAGSTCYADFDKAASDAFAKIGQGQQPEKFLEIAQSYPNSKIAPRAMLAAADAYEVAAKPQQAAHVLRQVLFKYPTGYDKAEVLEGLARNYLALGRIEVALSRLAQADRLLGDAKIRHALRLPNGQVVSDVTFGQALDALRKYEGRATAVKLPDFRLPAPHQGGPKRPDPFLPQTDDSIVADVTALAMPLPEFMRYDRVAVWSADKGLRVHAVGSGSAMLASTALSDAPQGVAWLEADLLAWSDKEIALIHDDGKTVWKIEVKGLPTIEVVNATDDPDEVTVAPQQAQPPRPMPDPVVIRLQENRRVRFPAPRRLMNGAIVQIQGGAAGAPGAAANGPVVEQIVEVRPAGDRVLVTTTTGRLMAIDYAAGQIAWQTRLTDRPIERLLATEDFAVVKCSDDAGVHIVVLDTFGGQSVSARRNFPLTDGGNLPNRPGIDNSAALVNLALAPDGTLVFTLPDRICGKDLYDPGAQLTFEVTVQPEGGNAFEGATRPDQLVIADDRILALSALNDSQFIRVHSLQTGRPLQVASPPLNKEVDALLSTGAKDWDVSIRYVAPYMYTISPKRVCAYNLDHPGPPGSANRSIDPNSFIRDAFVGQDYLVLLDGLRATAPGQPAIGAMPPGPAAAAAAKITQPSFRLLAHSRAPMASGESGILDHMVTVTDRSGIVQWEPVEGGFYYLTGARELHLLRGARK